MQRLKIKTKGGNYCALIGYKTDQLGEILKPVKKPCKVAIITDSNVGALYLARVFNSMKDAGYQPFTFSFESGEAQKTAGTLAQLYDFLCDSQISRTDLILALGGGVVGDIVGYAAATYLRGVDFVQVPTTLLAMVDSSVGGKVAINIPQGKNLVGAFYQPKLVFCDLEMLCSLPQKEVLNGLGEVVKYGCIADKFIISLLEAAPQNLFNFSDLAFWEDLITRCIKIKSVIVKRDTTDIGIRQLLNFGHTLGHCIEAHSGFIVPHGSAVVLGILMINEFGQKLGITDPAAAKRVADLVKTLGFECAYPVRAKALYSLAINDKKRKSNEITIVLMEKLGGACLRNFDFKTSLELM